jgi:hypothetical protein
MRARIVFGILSVVWLCGCQATLQGTAKQFEDTCAMPTRALQGSDRVGVAVPTAGDALRGTADMRVVPASLQGSRKLTENAQR